MTEKSMPDKPGPDEPGDIPSGAGSRKGKGAPPRRPIKGKMLVKPKPGAGQASAGAAKRGADRVERGDQVPAARRTRTPERYVRFRVHVEDGEASIIDSHLVASPLVTPATIHGEYAYEVTDGTRLLHAESIPDLGQFRSFPDPEGSREQRGHHITDLWSYDFDARVPAEELVRDALPNIDIVLHRVKEQTTMRLVPNQPLGAQFERELREVTRVQGIPHRLLPAALRDTGGRTRKRNP